MAPSITRAEGGIGLGSILEELQAGNIHILLYHGIQDHITATKSNVQTPQCKPMALISIYRGNHVKIIIILFAIFVRCMMSKIVGTAVQTDKSGGSDSRKKFFFESLSPGCAFCLLGPTLEILCQKGIFCHKGQPPRPKYNKN